MLHQHLFEEIGTLLHNNIQSSFNAMCKKGDTYQKNRGIRELLGNRDRGIRE